MEKFDFTCTRHMEGDRSYVPGDTRSLSVLDALPLVQSGALKPKGKAAEAAIAEVSDTAPGRQVVQGLSAKDAGDAELNKADVANPDAGSGAGGGEPEKPADAAAAAAGSAPAQTASPAQTKDAGGAAKSGRSARRR